MHQIYLLFLMSQVITEVAEVKTKRSQFVLLRFLFQEISFCATELPSFANDFLEFPFYLNFFSL